MSRGSNAHEQCPTVLFLAWFIRLSARLPGKRDYLENLLPGSRHRNTGIQANLAWLGCHIVAKLIFVALN